MTEGSCAVSSDVPRRWVHAFGEASSELETAQLLEAVASHYGLRGYLLINVPTETSTDFASCVLMTTWPEDMLRRYDRSGLFYGSPVIDRLRHNTTPFTYDTVRTNNRRIDGKAQAAVSLFGQFGLPRGAYFPAHSFTGQRGALGFGGERESLSPREMIELNAIANLAFTKVLDFKSRGQASVSLSRREVECLSWASAGKTSVEMSEILGLSEYTVNHYLNRATRKLDAVNRVQAVAKAIRAGLLN